MAEVKRTRCWPGRPASRGSWPGRSCRPRGCRYHHVGALVRKSRSSRRRMRTCSCGTCDAGNGSCRCWADLQAGLVEAALDRTAAPLQFEISQPSSEAARLRLRREASLSTVSSRLSCRRGATLRVWVPGKSCVVSFFEDEGVIVQQRQRIGGELVQAGILQAQRGLGRRKCCSWLRRLAM